MPVPTWDCPELALLYDQPVDVTTTTVVSEDIWKKFDLDFPQPLSLDSTGYRYYGGIEDGIIPDPYERSTTFGIYEKSGSSPLLSSSSTSRIEAREIRHHDCMWAGLCISKEHNRTHPAKKKEVHNQMSKKTAVPAGRSLLINRKQPASCNATTATMPGLTKNLESDGDSTRPETPQSCESESDEEEDEEDEEEEEEEEEEEMPRFKHDSISINDKLSEYVQVHVAGEINPSAAVPVSEVTGQLLPRKISRVNIRAGQQFNDHTKQQHGVKYPRKEEKAKANKAHFYPNNNGDGNNRQDFNRTTNTVYTQSNNNCTNIVSLGDHCYHLNQTSSSKKLEHLGVQTPSDSEEEIDVVTFDKPSCRPASLPTNPSLADKHHLQKTVTSALKDKAPPRPRGRPPSTSTPRKRSAQSETAAKRPAKKPKQKTTMSYQKRSNNRANNNNNNHNQNNNNNNNNVERDANCCNSRVSIDTDCSDINDELSGAETTRENNSFTNDRRRGGENNGTSTTTTRVSGAGKESNKLSNTSTCSRSTSSDEEPDTEKRSLHNNMERQRRIELRKAFEDLRVLVPEVEMKEKAPKVVILRQAAIYCDLLTGIGQTTLATVEELKSRQDKLRSKLSQLRRNFRTERTGAEVRNSSQHNRRARRGSGLQG